MAPVSVIYCWNVWTDPESKPDMKEHARKWKCGMWPKACEFSHNGQKECSKLFAFFFFFKAFSFDNEVYRSYLVLVEIPA